MAEQQLTEFLKTEAGQYLRGIVRYDDYRFETIYVRDDVNDETFQTRVARIYDRLVEQTADYPNDEPFGKPYATLNVREHAVVLNLRWSSSEGVLIGLDPDAARQLVGFIHETMKRGFPEGLPTEN